MREIEETIKQILINNFGVSKLVADQYLGEPLTGSLFALRGRDMVYLLMLVEKEFSILLTEKDIVDYRFNSIEDITKCILSHSQVSY